MIGRRGKRKSKEQSVSRNPHLNAQKQAIFRYSSNRMNSERSRRMPEPVQDKDVNRLSPANRYGLIFFALIILLVSLYNSLLLGAPTLRLVDANGERLTSNSEYEKVAASAAEQGIFSYSKLSIDRLEVASKLQSRFPELQDVTVKTPLFSNQVAIEAKAANPTAILNTGTESYVLDKDGTAIFNKESNRTGVVLDNIPIINDLSGPPVKIGEPALTPTQMAFIIEIRRQSEAKQLSINNIQLVGGGGEFNLNHGDLLYYVKYNVYEDARKSFGTFIAAKEYAEAGKIATPKEYIDVRLPERAYIK